LARGSAKALENHVDVGSFSAIGLATNNEVIGEQEGVNLGAVGPESYTFNVIVMDAVLKANGKFIQSKDK
jgi:hypothetical protein